MLPVVAEMLAGHTGLAVRLLLVDRNIRLVEEGIDVAVRIGELHDSGLRSIAIGMVRQVLVASPDYLARRGHPSEPRALAGYDLIAGDVRSGVPWRLGPGSLAIAMTPRLRVNAVEAQLAAAEAGLGIANVLSYQAAAGLAAGRLVPVLPDHTPLPAPVHLLFEAGRSRMPSLRLFVDGMRAQVRKGAWS